MECFVFKDLLPKYIAGLTSGETNAEMREHLDECAGCRAAYEEMQGSLPGEITLVKSKSGISRKQVFAGAVVCAVLLTGFVVFAKNYHIPVPFDPNHMSVEPYKAAVVTKERDKISWMDINRISDLVPKENDKVLDVMDITYQGSDRLDSNAVGRNIKRNGGDVRVIYYCCTETLWDRLWFVDSYLERISYTQNSGGYERDIYGDAYQKSDYDPRMVEIYYLPVKNLEDVEHLSDEEYEQLSEKSRLIWSGVV